MLRKYQFCCARILEILLPISAPSMFVISHYRPRRSSERHVHVHHLAVFLQKRFPFAEASLFFFGFKETRWKWLKFLGAVFSPSWFESNFIVQHISLRKFCRLFHTIEQIIYLLDHQNISINIIIIIIIMLKNYYFKLILLYIIIQALLYKI